MKKAKRNGIYYGQKLYGWYVDGDCVAYYHTTKRRMYGNRKYYYALEQAMLENAIKFPTGGG